MVAWPINRIPGCRGMEKHAAAILLLCMVSGAQAQSIEPDWRETKCARYRAAWEEAIRRRGPSGLSEPFLKAHDDFLKTGCETPAYVCPQSKEELALANIMVIRAMNAGTASTFLPFACRR